MRSKILIIVIAIVLGLGAAFLGAQYLSGARAKIAEGAEPVKVLVALREIPQGTAAETLVSGGFAEEREIPRQYVTDGAISSLESVAGKVTAASIARGEQLTNPRFTLAAELGLSFALPDGYVAVSVPDNPTRAVSGFVTPGDYIMVLATFDEGSLEGVVTKTLIKKARVIATGKETTQTATPKTDPVTGEPVQVEQVPTLTLALSPVDAERIVFAQEAGSVWYALISSEQTVIPDTSGERYPGVMR